MVIDVEPSGESGGFCDCCGNRTRTVWGYAREEGGDTLASYFLQWTVGKFIEDHPANFDLIYGAWGEGTTRSDRRAISLVHFISEGVPGVSIIDAHDRPIATSELVGSAMSREELVGTPLAQQVFGIFDAVVSQDNRLN